MDMEFSEFLWTIGDPSWVHAAPGETLRTRYNEMYAGRANIQDQLAQEAVAHMQELHYAGFLSDADVAPVLDDLMRMRGGAESRSLTGGGDPLFALDASTGQSMRRDLDALGYYSQALEAAKSWNQKKGTPEQALMWLKKSGVKDAEIEATGLRAFLEGKQSVTRDEVVAHLEGNRVGLTERRYSNEIDDTKPPVRRVYRDDYGGFRTDDEPVMAPGVVGEPHWQSFSLDPDNPTYRETVLHLPAVQKNDADAIAAMIDRGEITAEEWQRRYQASGLYDAGARETAFRSGHFSEPNIIGHMMTSMTTHQGKPVYTIDQIQSDWGQKIRDSGAQDPERSAELKQALDAERERVADILKEANAAVPSEKRASLMDLVSHNMGPHALLRITTSLLLDHIRGHERGFVGRLIKGAPNNRLKELGDELEAGVTNLRRLEAEYAQSRQSAPGNPLVNTTDQWVNTTLRRAIRQAAEADADYIAIPRGDTVLSYNPEGPDGPNGMRVFYGRSDKEGIVPKNLRNILERMDKDSARPMPVEALTTPTKGVTNRGDLRISDGGSDFGFTLFPLTDKVKQSVMKEGQPLFAIKAFHGSPHEFNAFKMDAIGTGEGAQAFGHGLYFAESKTVANFYREGLSAGVRARQVFDELGTRFPAARDAIEAAYGDLDDAITILQRDGGKTAEIDAITRAKSEIESAKSGGHLYEVSIKEDADKFLDWDKPLGEQTAFVRKALGIDDFAKVDDGSILKAFAKAASKEDGHAPTIDLAYDAYAAMAQNKGRAPLDFRGFERALLDSGFRIGRFAGADRVIGMQVDNVPEVNKHLASPAMMPRDFIRRVGKGEDQSKYFTDRGIPGVRYLDANSRGMIIGDKYAETGTRNIVVFDDSLVRITSKNGEPFIRQEVIDALKPKRSEPLAALRGNRPSDRLDTPEFKSWFGDSKVVDESGKPLVMYHGTARAGFDFFDTYASNYGLMGMGGYFTENPDVAGGYTNKGAKKMERQGRDPTPAIYPVYLSIKNPIDMDAPADIAAWSKVGNEYGADFTDGMTNEQAYRELESALQDEQMPSYEGAEIMQDALRDMGFDGITHVGGGRVDAAGVRHRVFIAFDPEQIKSVNNQGTFSPTDQRILFALSREPPAPPIKSDIAFVDRLNQIKDLVEACRA